MNIFEWAALYEFFSVNFNWIFGSIIGIILFLFWKTEKSSFSKSGWQTLGKGWSLPSKEDLYIYNHTGSNGEYFGE